MAILHWCDEFQTGVDYLDDEHRRLLDLVNTACQDLQLSESDENVIQCLGELYARICGHFALEEQLLQKRKYALYELHKSHHETLLEEMRDMMDAYENGACADCGKTLKDCLIAWFRKHFRIEDARLQSL